MELSKRERRWDLRQSDEKRSGSVSCESLCQSRQRRFAADQLTVSCCYCCFPLTLFSAGPELYWWQTAAVRGAAAVHFGQLC